MRPGDDAGGLGDDVAGALDELPMQAGQPPEQVIAVVDGSRRSLTIPRPRPEDTRTSSSISTSAWSPPMPTTRSTQSITAAWLFQAATIRGADTLPRGVWRTE